MNIPQFDDWEIEGAWQGPYPQNDPIGPMVRIAIAFFAGQPESPAPRYSGGKHSIEAWAGRYIAEPAVETAARLLGLKGNYPNFGVMRRLPHPDVLAGIPEAFTHPQYCDKLKHLVATSGRTHPNVLAVLAKAQLAEKNYAKAHLAEKGVVSE